MKFKKKTYTKGLRHNASWAQFHSATLDGGVIAAAAADGGNGGGVGDIV